MTDQERAEMWESVAKVFDDLLTQIREIALNELDNTQPYETQRALGKIVRLIGKPASPMYQQAQRARAEGRLSVPPRRPTARPASTYEANGDYQ